MRSTYLCTVRVYVYIPMSRSDPKFRLLGDEDQSERKDSKVGLENKVRYYSDGRSLMPEQMRFDIKVPCPAKMPPL